MIKTIKKINSIETLLENLKMIPEISSNKEVLRSNNSITTQDKSKNKNNFEECKHYV